MYYIFRSNVIINKASQKLMPCFSFGLGSYKESAGSRQELIWKAKSIQGKQFKKMLFSSTAARICEVSKHPYMGMCVIRWDLYTKTGGFLTLKQWWEQEVKEQYNIPYKTFYRYARKEVSKRRVKYSFYDDGTTLTHHNDSDRIEVRISQNDPIRAGDLDSALTRRDAAFYGFELMAQLANAGDAVGPDDPRLCNFGLWHIHRNTTQFLSVLQKYGYDKISVHDVHDANFDFQIDSYTGMAYTEALIHRQVREFEERLRHHIQGREKKRSGPLRDAQGIALPPSVPWRQGNLVPEPVFDINCLPADERALFLSVQRG